MRIFIIIPAYNEADNLEFVLHELDDTKYNVVVVDDGSTDDTAAIAGKHRVCLLKHLVNLGQGAALRTGTDFALQNGADIIVHFDADNQHRVGDIAILVEAIKNGEADITLGSRFLSVRSDLPLRKKFVLFFAKIFSRSILKLEFSDPQNGLRAFRREIRTLLDWQANDFSHCSEILSIIAKKKLRYQEVPVKINYEGRIKKSVRPRLRMGWRLLFNKIIE